MSSNFEKVIEFNVQSGVINDSNILSQPNILGENPIEVERCLKLIREEVSELEKAVLEKDYIETADALTDILYVVYGMGARLGINLDKTFHEVHENNMSKLCSSEEEAIRTVEYYLKNPHLGYLHPSYRLSPDSTKYIVYNSSTGKILKSINWKNVDLKKVLS
jgi:NTP pyrophosphatase (non-canonical NTP hydrolase)